MHPNLAIFLFFASIPVIVMALVPNRVTWFLGTALLLFFIFGIPFLEIFHTLTALIILSFVALPILLLKILAIYLESSGKTIVARILPFFAILSPVLIVCNTGQLGRILQPITSQECLNITVTPQINGYMFRLSPLGLFQIDQEIFSRSLKTSELSNLCRETDNGKNPFPAKSIHFQHPNNLSAFCRAKNTGWKKDLCADAEWKIGDREFPIEMTIFEKGTSSQELLPLGNESTYGYYRENLSQNMEIIQAADNLPKVAYLKGRIGNSVSFIWVTDDSSWVTPDGQPYATKCSASVRHCQTAYPINAGLIVKYTFKSTLDALPSRAKIVDARVNEMIRDWLTLQSTEPK